MRVESLIKALRLYVGPPIIDGHREIVHITENGVNIAIPIF